MRDSVKEYQIKGGENKVIKIIVEDSPQSPREDDNMSKMICFHRNYNLGDSHDYNHNDYSGWDELTRAIIKEEKPAIILPLFIYDHSGITISTTPFGCRWDSMQVGFVIVTKEKIKEEFGVKRITKKLIESATKTLLAEVETYDQYLIGDVYGFVVEKDGEQEDSCWGFYGSDIETNGMLDYIGEKFENLIEI